MAKAQFDRSDIVEKSARLFWQNGFSGSSMQKLFQATGLKSGSVYLAFGSKEKLYKEALEQYAEGALQQLSAVLDQAASVRDGICQILLAMMNEAEQENYCSCFLIKSRLELAEEYPELHACAGEQLKRIESLYASALAREMEPSAAADHANQLMLQMFGLRVYGYSMPDKSMVMRSLMSCLPWLPWDRHTQTIN